METTRNSVKVKLGMKVMKFVESLISLEISYCPRVRISFTWTTLHSWEGDFTFLKKISVSTIKLLEWRFQAFHEVSLFEQLTGKSPCPHNKIFIRGASLGASHKLRDKNAIGRRRWNITTHGTEILGCGNWNHLVCHKKLRAITSKV